MNSKNAMKEYTTPTNRVITFSDGTPMDKKNYTENDEIELRLTHNVSTHYWLEWRFKKPKGRFLWFDIHDKWKSIPYYTPGIFTPDMDPDSEYNWYWRGFDLGKKHDVQEYDGLRDKIRTKKQLFDHFNVDGNTEKYNRDLERHRAWLNEVNENIKRLV